MVYGIWYMVLYFVFCILYFVSCILYLVILYLVLLPTANCVYLVFFTLYFVFCNLYYFTSIGSSAAQFPVRFSQEIIGVYN